MSTSNDAAVERLVSASKDVLAPLHAPSSHFDQRRIAEIMARARRRSPLRRAPAIFALAGAALVAVGAVRMARTPTLTVAAEGGEIVGGELRSRPGSSPSLRFSDGTKVSFAPDAHARVSAVGPRGARLELSRGRAHVDVVPREGAQWWVEAGPYTVAVKGTVFDVAWEPTDQVFELVMIRGQVEVRGPAASSGGISLQAGQRLTARPREARIVVDDGDVTPGATTRLPPAAPSVVPAAAAPTPRETPPVPAHDRRQVEPTNWDKLVAAGNFSAVLTAAEHAGVATVLARAPATDLVALADAARYERRADLAERTLLALRRRFASAPEAAEAAFLLGRLVESGTPADALSWYDHYLAEAPSGPYLAEALGRKMSLVRRQQGDEAARPIARSYLERFPTGAHASLARTLVGGP